MIAVELWVGLDRKDGGTWGEPALTEEAAVASVRAELQRVFDSQGVAAEMSGLPDSAPDWTVEQALAEDCGPLRLVLAADDAFALEVAVRHLVEGSDGLTGRLMRGAHPARLVATPTAPEPPSDGLLGELLAALGWQGGTRQQALEAVRGLVALAAAHGSKP